MLYASRKNEPSTVLRAHRFVDPNLFIYIRRGLNEAVSRQEPRKNVLILVDLSGFAVV